MDRLRHWWFRNVAGGIRQPNIERAKAGRGNNSVIRHVGRKSGQTFETPVVLGERAEGLVVTLTYGPDVQWLKNIEAAGRCEVVHRGEVRQVVAIEPFSGDYWRGFPHPYDWILRVAPRREARLLRLG